MSEKNLSFVGKFFWGGEEIWKLGLVHWQEFKITSVYGRNLGLKNGGRACGLMPAVHSRRGNPRKGENENVDGNTRLALDPLM